MDATLEQQILTVLEKSSIPLSVEDIAHEVDLNQSVYVNATLKRMFERCDIVRISKSDDTKCYYTLASHY